MDTTNSIFEYTMKVRDYECDAQGIVNNANYQHYYEVARHEFLEHCGINFSELYGQGIAPVVSSILVKYKHSLCGGQPFVCTVSAIRKEGVRYIFDQHIVRTSDNKICSEAQVDVVCMVHGKVSRPSLFDEAFAHYTTSFDNK